MRQKTTKTTEGEKKTKYRERSRITRKSGEVGAEKSCYYTPQRGYLNHPLLLYPALPINYTSGECTKNFGREDELNARYIFEYMCVWWSGMVEDRKESYNVRFGF